MASNRSAKKVLMLGVYLAAIILGIYMSFFQKMEVGINEEQNTEQQELTGQIGEEELSVEHDYIYLEFPEMENESADELYSESGADVTNIYFSNTALLDNGSMPLEVQAVLAQAAEAFLSERGYDDVTELYIEENSYEEDGTKILFVCYMDGYEDVLQIEYIFDAKRLQFRILSS